MQADRSVRAPLLLSVGRTLAAALRSFSTSAGVSFAGSTEIVSFSILPLNLTDKAQHSQCSNC
jgi:hypothetical protein